MSFLFAHSKNSTTLVCCAGVEVWGNNKRGEPVPIGAESQSQLEMGVVGCWKIVPLIFGLHVSGLHVTDSCFVVNLQLTGSQLVIA